MNIKAWVMVLISILLAISVSCQMTTNLFPSGGPNPGSFTAAATSPISVQLDWSGVEGAQKYVLERKDGQEDYLPVAEVSEATTSFEDFLVPAQTQLSYRIKTVTASGTSGGKTVSITTPEEKPNPLTVEATFEAQNAQTQAIGPDGGSISMTDSKGVGYTLDVPAGALDSEATFTLTPIQEIRGLPLSGGMTSGVRIEPEGLIFNQSATLSIETTEPDAADEMINLAFAFDGEGSEFHFVPSSAAKNTGAVLKLARPASVASWNAINVQKTRSYGNGRGTSKDIRNQVKNHAPSSPADRLNQKMAASDADLLTPLAPDRTADRGREVELQVAAIDDWSSYSNAMWTFIIWWDDTEQRRKDSDNPDLWKKREDAIWEELTTNAKLKLEKAAEDCKKSPNLADAKRLVNQLIKGSSPFYRKFAEKYSQRYGAGTLEKIKAQLDKCTTGYKVDWTFPNYAGSQADAHFTGLSCGSPYGPWEIKMEGTGLGGSYHIPFSESGRAPATFEEHAYGYGGLIGYDEVATATAIITPSGGGYQISLENVTITGTAWAGGRSSSAPMSVQGAQGLIFIVVPAEPSECSQP